MCRRRPPRERVLETTEEQVVHGRQQQERLVPSWGRLADELEHVVVRDNDGATDLVVQRRVSSWHDVSAK